MSNDLQPSGLSQEWMQKLADAAKEQASTEKAAGNFFSTKGGMLSFNNMALPGNKMEVVVLLAAHENVYYAQKFDANAPASPLCYALSHDGAGMVPHPDADVRQSPTCASCPQLAWVGDVQGKQRKNCKEQRRLCVIPATATASVEGVQTATAGLLRVPVTSVKYWASYVNGLAVKQLPTYAVICEIALIPDAKTMFRIEFKPLRPVDNQVILGAIEERMAREKLTMLSPYPKRVAAPQQSVQGLNAVPPANPLGMQQPPPPPPAFGAPPPPVKF